MNRIRSMFMMIFVTLQICSARADVDNNKIPETTQKVYAIPFTYFENLYFDTNARRFYGLGSGINPNISIGPYGQGFSFGSIESLQTSSDQITVLDGSTLFLFEHPGTAAYLGHFFHFLEHVTGIWSFYGNQNYEDVKLIVFASDGNNQSPWEGANFTNYHTIKALFPKAELLTWSAFTQKYQNKWLRMERVVTSDRTACNYSPECGKVNKLLGAALPKLSKEALDNMAQKVHEYTGTREVNRDKINVTYLKRYNSGRALDDNLEDRLLAAICTIPGINLSYHWFEFLSFHEQMQIIGNTDVLISVHGNGLSHILFLPPNASAVEIYPYNCNTLDYRILADGRKLDFLGIISNRGVIEREEAYEVGPYGQFDSRIYDMDLEPILEFIRKKVASGK